MYEYKCKLFRVVDGDTVEVDIDLGFDVWLQKQSVRLDGIDTPESRTKDKAEKACGLLAKKFVEDVFASAKTITLHCTKYNSDEKFGRILGDFCMTFETREPMVLVPTLLTERLGVAYEGQSKEEIQEAHLKNRAFLLEKNPTLF